jgi:ornithine carbamoyltransferase
MADLTKQDIYKILNLGDQMKYNLKHNLPHRMLEGKHLAMIFSKSSTRTRVSFEVGMNQLGGKALFLSNNDIQLGRGESVEDTAQVLSRYVDGIMIRTFAQSEVEELARHASIPVINGLTDYSHPCQILADLMTIREYLTSLEGRTVAFIGDGGDNVCHSLIVGALACEMNVKVASPPEYPPHPNILAFAGNRVLFTRDPREAVENADVVITDVWTSMGQEAEAETRKRILAPYQLNAELMKLAAEGAIVQHGLPAHKGEEITEEVFVKHAKEIYDEAENRLHAQKAVMAIVMGGA